MRLASLLAKVATGDAAALPAATTLRMATLAGAAALGMDARIGSLEPGKAPDATAVDLANFDTVPVYDPVSHLVNVASRNDVTDVWVDGRRVVNARRFYTLDEAALAARAAAWQQRLA
jgi:5-methylthioadenosine/S-adenosylhomocysteine deaminase